MKLRGRTEAPAHGAEGAQSLSARGAKQEAPHGPLQRLLEVQPALVNGRAFWRTHIVSQEKRQTRKPNGPSNVEARRTSVQFVDAHWFAGTSVSRIHAHHREQEGKAGKHNHHVSKDP